MGSPPTGICIRDVSEIEADLAQALAEMSEATGEGDELAEQLLARWEALSAEYDTVKALHVLAEAEEIEVGEALRLAVREAVQRRGLWLQVKQSGQTTAAGRAWCD